MTDRPAALEALADAHHYGGMSERDKTGARMREAGIISLQMVKSPPWPAEPRVLWYVASWPDQILACSRPYRHGMPEADFFTPDQDRHDLLRKIADQYMAGHGLPFDLPGGMARLHAEWSPDPDRIDFIAQWPDGGSEHCWRLAADYEPKAGWTTVRGDLPCGTWKPGFSFPVGSPAVRSPRAPRRLELTPAMAGLIWGILILVAVIVLVLR